MCMLTRDPSLSDSILLFSHLPYATLLTRRRVLFSVTFYGCFTVWSSLSILVQHTVRHRGTISPYGARRTMVMGPKYVGAKVGQGQMVKQPIFLLDPLYLFSRHLCKLIVYLQICYIIILIAYLLECTFFSPSFYSIHPPDG